MNKIRLSKASIGVEEKEAVLRVLDAEYLGMGQEVQLFEEELADYIGVPRNNVICVNTGTSALHLALSALDIGPGDEVIVPSLTYVASFQAISATGAIPVACEVNEDTLFIDPIDAEKKISTKTKAIMPVHYASSSYGICDIYKIAKKHNLRVVEDAAQSFGSIDERGLVGGFGDVICFSFDGIKNITCGEGGAIITKDSALIQRLQDGRLLGVEKDTLARYEGNRSWDFDVNYQGFRFHMSNINAAIGRVQLRRLPDFSQRRKEIAERYNAGLQNIESIEPISVNFKNIIPHIFVVKAKQRDLLRKHLISSGVECGIHYKPNHLLTKFSQNTTLPITESVYRTLLTLPCHYDLSNDDVDTVVKHISDFYHV